MAAVNLMCARVNKVNQNQLNANCQKIKIEIEINLQLNAFAFVQSVRVYINKNSWHSFVLLQSNDFEKSSN